jgi:hypothetical protein
MVTDTVRGCFHQLAFFLVLIADAHELASCGACDWLMAIPQNFSQFALIRTRGLLYLWGHGL